VNYVDEIPLLSSGKRRQIVNEYYKDWITLSIYHPMGVL
jgi:hypothetical protein